MIQHITSDSITNFTATPTKIAIPKLNKVPTKTYSDFTVSVSLNLRNDLAAKINPMASYCPNMTKTSVNIRSTLPITRPAIGSCTYAFPLPLKSKFALVPRISLTSLRNISCPFEGSSSAQRCTVLALTRKARIAFMLK